eukprot:c27193_g1_i1 orf=31-414(+)
MRGSPIAAQIPQRVQVSVMMECPAWQPRGLLLHHRPLGRAAALRPLPQKPSFSLHGHRQAPGHWLVTKASANDEDGAGSNSSNDDSSSTPLSGTLNHLKISTQIFLVVLVYIAYFFGASAWDGRRKK